MSGRELRELREEADVTRGELSLRIPDVSAQMIQRIEEGLKAVPDTYPAELRRALSAIGAARKAKADAAAAKIPSTAAAA